MQIGLTRLQAALLRDLIDLALSITAPRYAGEFHSLAGHSETLTDIKIPKQSCGGFSSITLLPLSIIFDPCVLCEQQNGPSAYTEFRCC